MFCYFSMQCHCAPVLDSIVCVKLFYYVIIELVPEVGHLIIIEPFQEYPPLIFFTHATLQLFLV